MKKNTARRKATVAAVAAALLLSLANPISASAFISVGNHFGDLSCTQIFAPNTATQSTARGNNVTHTLQFRTQWGSISSLKATMGSSAAYAPWGWTFWQGNTSIALNVTASGNTSKDAHVIDSSLKRWCTLK